MEKVTWLCVTPERERKTRRLMVALAQGLKGRSKIIMGPPPSTDTIFFVWGMDWLALRIIPDAVAFHRPFFQIDNGFFKPARGGANGYYRFTYRSLSPIFLTKAPPVRSVDLKPYFKDWRKDGRHVLIALPGQMFGRALGMDMPKWIAGIVNQVRTFTDRPIIVRPKDDPMPLSFHLDNAWALVTHSSNVAVDAVLAGIPVFVAPTSPAAPVGNLDLADLENPAMPMRQEWWKSLMAQQFTINEMRQGVANSYLKLVIDQTDGG